MTHFRWMPPSVCGFFLVEKKTVTDDNHRVGLAIRSKQSALIIPVDFTRSQLRFFFLRRIVKSSGLLSFPPNSDWRWDFYWSNTAIEKWMALTDWIFWIEYRRGKDGRDIRAKMVSLGLHSLCGDKFCYHSLCNICSYRYTLFYSYMIILYIMKDKEKFTYYLGFSLTLTWNIIIIIIVAIFLSSIFDIDSYVLRISVCLSINPTVRSMYNSVFRFSFVLPLSKCPTFTFTQSPYC